MVATSDRYTMRDGFKDFILNKAELKKELEEYITAPQFSLELRWQMFVDAPPELSNHSTSIYYGLDKIITGHTHDNTWLELLTDDRHQQFDLVDLVNEEFSNPEDYDLDDFSNTKDLNFLTNVKEQILKDNIKSFTYDW